MKIVTYNVNGLRPRISQHGSLLKLLDSFDADVICLQETKLRRPELTADGYESFFSCSRSSDRGRRSGYSGVATFCRVKSAFASVEAALPVAAEEGFTGVLESSSSSSSSSSRSGSAALVAPGLEEFERDELLRVDGEGRCVVTDHTHFVLFNVYGPRAESDDLERIDFKLKFFKIMQVLDIDNEGVKKNLLCISTGCRHPKLASISIYSPTKRWESLLCQGRKVFVVGDLNIAPTSLDRCDAGPDFENNEFRRWFRSMLVDNGGAFFDVFRTKHPDRRDAFTCWPQNTGAEEFNYGTRIDHILCAGPCLHQEQDQKDHNFFTCHVKECDILTQYKRWKPGNTLRWKGGRRIKLEGSDHAPVYACLQQIPSVAEHSTPSLSARYIPMVYGVQQTLVSALMRRQVSQQTKSYEASGSSPDEDFTLGGCTEREKRAFDQCGSPGVPPTDPCSLPSQESKVLISREDMDLGASGNEVACDTSITSASVSIGTVSSNQTKKKANKNQWSQLTLKSFFQKSSVRSCRVDNVLDSSANQVDTIESNHQSNDPPIGDDQSENTSQSDSPQQCNFDASASTNSDQYEVKNCSSEKNSVALMEWQRIQQMMQNTIPLCKGHKEPCVARVVKKQGPNFGRRFYVCARAEGPASNPEANCGYFKWAASKLRGK